MDCDFFFYALIISRARFQFCFEYHRECLNANSSRRDGYKKRNEQDTNLHSTFSLSRDREREKYTHSPI